MTFDEAKVSIVEQLLNSEGSGCAHIDSSDLPDSDELSSFKLIGNLVHYFKRAGYDIALCNESLGEFGYYVRLLVGLPGVFDVVYSLDKFFAKVHNWKF